MHPLKTRTRRPDLMSELVTAKLPLHCILSSTSSTNYRLERIGIGAKFSQLRKLNFNIIVGWRSRRNVNTNNRTHPDFMRYPEFGSHGNCEGWSQTEWSTCTFVHPTSQGAHEARVTEIGKQTWKFQLYSLLVYGFASYPGTFFLGAILDFVI